MQSDILVCEMEFAKLGLKSFYTLFDLRGDTKTLCKAETFFGEMSGNVEKIEATGDPGASPAHLHEVRNL